MNRNSRNRFAVSLLLAFGWPVYAGSPSIESAAPAPRITVLVYNYAQIPDKTLRQAQEKAAWTFAQAGIETDWVDCTESANRPLTGANWVTLRILPRSMAKQFEPPRGVMGMALLDQSETLPHYAFVFFDRVEERAGRLRCYLPTVLSLAMAHEIGHLLLGAGGHTSTGMMRATWKRADMKRAETKRLRFSRGEAKKMRSQIAERM